MVSYYTLHYVYKKKSIVYTVVKPKIVYCVLQRYIRSSHVKWDFINQVLTVEVKVYLHSYIYVQYILYWGFSAFLQLSDRTLN